MIKDSLFFSIDGIDCRNKGIHQVHSDSGLFEESFIPSRDIIETETNLRQDNYFYGLNESPIEFELTCYFDVRDEPEKLKDIKSYFFYEHYKQIKFENDNRIFYGLFIGNSSIFHSGDHHGYFRVTCRTNSSKAFSPVFTDFFDITGQQEVIVENKGVEASYPVLKIRKKNAGDVRIVNLNDGGKEFSIINCINDERIEIDSEYETLETSDISRINIYDDSNQGYIRLVTGVNRLLIEGDGYYEIIHQDKVI